jgi:hypothetical protein
VLLGVDFNGSDPGYEFQVAVNVSYKLDSAGLTVTVRAQNMMTSLPAPFQAGCHPYVVNNDSVPLCYTASSSVQLASLAAHVTYPPSHAYALCLHSDNNFVFTNTHDPGYFRICSCVRYLKYLHALFALTFVVTDTQA